MNPYRKRLIISAEPDPFCNMIIRTNRSPRLKPVIVTAHECLKISKSAGSIRNKVVLPPMISNQSFKNLQKSERNTLKTPYFKASGNKFAKNSFELNKNACFEHDLSFGDIDEKVGGLNDIMNKYHG